MDEEENEDLVFKFLHLTVICYFLKGLSHSCRLLEEVYTTFAFIYLRLSQFKKKNFFWFKLNFYFVKNITVALGI